MSEEAPLLIEQADTAITEDAYVCGGGLRQVRDEREKCGRGRVDGGRAVRTNGG